MKVANAFDGMAKHRIPVEWLPYRCLSARGLTVRLCRQAAESQRIWHAFKISRVRATELSQQIGAAGFDIVAAESHSTKDKGRRPYIVAHKK